MNAATQKTLTQIKRACERSTDGWADLASFDLKHVIRLERAGLVVPDTRGAAVRAPGHSWRVRVA